MVKKLRNKIQKNKLLQKLLKRKSIRIIVLLVVFVLILINVFLFINLRSAFGATLALYARSTALTSPPFPSTSKKMITTAGTTANTATRAQTGTNTSGYFQFKPLVTNSTREASLPAGITQNGWIYDVDQNCSVMDAGAWTLRFRWRASGTACRGYLNYRISKVTVSGGTATVVSTLLGWTEYGTVLAPASTTTTYTTNITTPSVSGTTFNSGEYLMIEWYIRPSVSCGSSTRYWTMYIDETEANSGTKFTTANVTAHSFAQKQYNWRWYNDNSNVPPADGNALANENTAPSEVSDTMVLRLRISVHETGSCAQAAASTRKLQYSTDPTFATGTTDVGAIGGAGAWRYYDGPATDGASVSSPYKLTSTTTGGLYLESNSYTYLLGKDAITEFEYTIQGNSSVGNTTYYFRLYDTTAGAAITTDTGKSYPSLKTTLTGSLSLSSISVTWTGVNPDNPPDNTGKGLTCTVTSNGPWQVYVDTSSGDSQGRLWSSANSQYYPGTFTYSSTGSAGPTYETGPTSFAVSSGTHVADYGTAVTDWNITVAYTLGTLSDWKTIKGTYTATHTYTLSAK